MEEQFNEGVLDSLKIKMSERGWKDCEELPPPTETAILLSDGIGNVVGMAMNKEKCGIAGYQYAGDLDAGPHLWWKPMDPKRFNPFKKSESTVKRVAHSIGNWLVGV